LSEYNNLNYEPSSEPLHISAKWLFVNANKKSLNLLWLQSLACVGEHPYTPYSSPYTPHHTPYTLHPTPYTLHPTPCTLDCVGEKPEAP